MRSRTRAWRRQRTHLVLRRSAAHQLPPASGRRRRSATRSRSRSGWRRRSKAAARAAHDAAADRRRLAVHFRLLLRIRSSASWSTSTTTSAIGGYAYNALSRVETDTFSPVFAELGEKFVGVRRRPLRGQRADVLRLERGSAAPVRKVAEDRQPPQRAAARRARGRAERLDQVGPHPINSSVARRAPISCHDSVSSEIASRLRNSATRSVSFCGQQFRYGPPEPSDDAAASKGSSDLNKRLTKMRRCSELTVG